ncbi:Asp23/Gls24 family envelope stress response protein [Nocardioides sp. C4-1]|uniref:Asp23/Gls24 family envelope stress response protein n=1 Tax=Nocardioides sp. C4-1 TaxID=3151851 RepID=UPI003267E169
MAEHTLATTAPETRGTLEVRVRAVEKIVERVVLDVPGTVAHRSTLRRLVGSGSPRASAETHAGRTHLDVHVTCRWPCAVADVAAQVRDRVRTETSRMAGVEVRTVDVTVGLVSPADLEQPGRRRVE